jgi:hypothetical protein
MKPEPEYDPEVKKAFEVIKAAMIADHPSEAGSYAHSWHCNITMACYDAMAEAASRTEQLFSHNYARDVANDAASRFMKICFDVETKA